MLFNFLKTAVRVLRRHPGYTAIHVVGLGVGFSVCLLIGLWVHEELSYDDFHPNADQIYRLSLHYKLSADHEGDTFALTPTPLAETLARTIPQVEQALRTARTPRLVRHGERSFVEDHLYRADPGFFDLFAFPLLQGEPGRVLEKTNALVLTESAAKKYFPNQTHVVGQTLYVDDEPYEVTGVAADPPTNTHFGFDIVARMPPEEDPTWFRNRVVTYVRLIDGARPDRLQSELKTLIVDRKRAADDPERDYALYLQPITGIHLGTGLPDGVALTDRRIRYTFGGTGSITYVYLFSALGGLVLLIACINFINLATARSTERAREVGMRKALGARRRTLAAQFVGEAVLMSGMGLLVALGLAHLGLPLLNALAGKTLSLSTLWNGPSLLLIVGGTVFVGVLAGSYPAFVLSGFMPTSVLRGRTQQASSERLRQGLVVVQFVAAVALIAGTGVVYQQLNYLHTKELGFEKEHTLLVELNDDFLERGDPALPKQALVDLPGVERVARANGVPGENFSFTRYRTAGDSSRAAASLYTAWGDYDYVESLGLTVTQGRDFSRDFPSDSSAMLLNEAAARLLFGDADPIGKRVTPTGPDSYPRTVVGVVENFHYQSLRRGIQPMAIFFLEFPDYWPAPEVMTVRLRPQNVAATLDAVARTWDQAVPNAPFDYSFLDERLDAQYRAERRLGRVFQAFAGLAIFVACLGLFGLAVHATDRRTKEIGIRKSLGATAVAIVALLSKDVLKLIGLACLIAVPITYVGMSQWLQDFAYRITMSPWLFVGACVLAAVVALATIAPQALRAARLDPATTLRDE